MDPRIARFLKKHHVLTLSTVSGQGSWSAHVFYAWMPDANALVFTTDPTTRHGREMIANPMVSGGIVLETKVVGRVRGVQVVGRVRKVENGERRGENREYRIENRESRGEDGEYRIENTEYRGEKGSGPRIAYLKCFPFAIAAKLDLWVLELEYVKMTDNRLGFGKKVEWRRGFGE